MLKRISLLFFLTSTCTLLAIKSTYASFIPQNANDTALIATLNRSPKAWTFAVYMGGANNLEMFTFWDIEEMQQVGTNTRINIAAQQTTLQETNQYLINYNSSTTLQQLRKINSADTTNLQAFFSKIFTQYPANYVCLILWDHGYGTMEPPFTFRSNQRTIKENRSFLIDTNYPVYQVGSVWGDVITTPKFVENLQALTTTIGHKIDILAFDACLMMQVEILCACAPYCTYMVGCPKPLTAYGFWYNKFLEPFKTGHQSPLMVCKKMLNTFEDFCKLVGFESYIMSTADPNYATQLEECFYHIAHDLRTCLAHQKGSSVKDTLYAATEESLIYDYPIFSDVYLFCQKIIENIDDGSFELDPDDPELIAELRTYLVQAQTLVDQAILYCVKGTGTERLGKGIGIYFPLRPGYVLDSYATLNFADNEWWNLINDYINTF